MNRQRVLSGVQASGRLHLGNYHGAFETWVTLQDQYECFFFIADWHALTALVTEPGKIREYTREAAIDLLACGLDPEKCTIFVQSEVPEHAELNLLLGMLTPVPWLERVPSYKDKKQELSDKDLSSIGFLGYPVLQAADITIYKAAFVPVGEDQLPHLELTREIVRRFNFIHGTVLVEPREIVNKVTLLPGLDGRKMSKSYNNAVFLSDDDETVRKKFSNAVTDPQRQRRTDPGRPEVCNIFAYHRLYTPGFRQHEIDHLCRTAGIGCVECKRELIDNFFTFFAPIRTKRAELTQRLPYVREVLDHGGQRAREVAAETMTVVREAMKLGWRI